MKGVACFGFDTRIYISNVLARLSPFLRFDSRLRGISNVTHSRVSLGEIEIEIEIEGTARITYDLSPPSFDRNGITLKKRKKKRKNAYVIGTYVIETITVQYVRRWMRNMRLTSRCPCQNVFDISLKVYK